MEGSVYRFKVAGCCRCSSHIFEDVLGHIKKLQIPERHATNTGEQRAFVTLFTMLEILEKLSSLPTPRVSSDPSGQECRV